MSNKLQFIWPAWPAPDNVKAVTSLRQGGVSQGAFDGLNLAEHVGDNVLSVMQNRQLLTQALGLPSQPVWLHQTHSTTVLDISAISSSPKYEADGALSTRAGVVCAVMTADCLPLFLTNKQGSKVAVIHAGWRGLAEGIVEAGVAAFNEPAENILAWSGPCISQDSFQIGEEVKQRLGGAESHYQAASVDGKYYADLYGLVDERLLRLGVNEHGWFEHCTYQQDALFYSYRRNSETGRMASLIWFD